VGWCLYALCEVVLGIDMACGDVTENKAIGVMKPGHTFTIEPMISEGTTTIIHFLGNVT
jgi:hypothetical protein